MANAANAETPCEIANTNAPTMWRRTIQGYGSIRRDLQLRHGHAGSYLLEVAALRLLPLDRLEQGLEVADAEATRTVPLDDLEEEDRSILDRSGEDLEEIALLVTIGLDAELLERLDWHAHI